MTKYIVAIAFAVAGAFIVAGVALMYGLAEALIGTGITIAFVTLVALVSWAKAEGTL